MVSPLCSSEKAGEDGDLECRRVASPALRRAKSISLTPVTTGKTVDSVPPMSDLPAVTMFPCRHGSGGRLAYLSIFARMSIGGGVGSELDGQSGRTEGGYDGAELSVFGVDRGMGGSNVARVG